VEGTLPSQIGKVIRRVQEQAMEEGFCLVFDQRSVFPYSVNSQGTVHELSLPFRFVAVTSECDLYLFSPEVTMNEEGRLTIRLQPTLGYFSLAQTATPTISQLTVHRSLPNMACQNKQNLSCPADRRLPLSC
jgi:hypothetical protein